MQPQGAGTNHIQTCMFLDCDIKHQQYRCCRAQACMRDQRGRHAQHEQTCNAAAVVEFVLRWLPGCATSAPAAAPAPANMAPLLPLRTSWGPGLAAAEMPLVAAGLRLLLLLLLVNEVTDGGSCGVGRDTTEADGSQSCSMTCADELLKTKPDLCQV